MVWVNGTQNLRNILKIGDEPDFADLPRMCKWKTMLYTVGSMVAYEPGGYSSESELHGLQNILQNTCVWDRV